jgi:hypothetical protein
MGATRSTRRPAKYDCHDLNGCCDASHKNAKAHARLSGNRRELAHNAEKISPGGGRASAQGCCNRNKLSQLGERLKKGTADGVAVPWVTELGFGPGDQLGSPAGWAMKHHDATFRQMKFTESIPTKKAKTTAPSTELKR